MKNQQERKLMGKLAELTIYSYDDPDFSNSAGKPYVVSINPEKYSHSTAIFNNKGPAAGSADAMIYDAPQN